MPATLTYPGVYIEEIPSGVRTITGVATSITAFVGRAARGPVEEPVVIASYSDFERAFGGLGVGYPMSYAVRDFFLNGGAQAIILRLYNVDDQGANATARITADTLNLDAASPGTWANQLRVRIDHAVPTGSPHPLGWVEADPALSDADLFNVTVRNTATGAQETFQNVTVAESPRRIDRVLERESLLIRAVTPLPGARPAAHADPAAGDPIDWADDAQNSGTTADGNDSPALVTGTYTGAQASSQGIRALDTADLVNILCIPPDTRGGNVPAAVWQHALSYCEDRRAMLIVDPPVGWTSPAAALDAATGVDSLGLNGTAARNAAIYGQRVLQSDPLREGQIDTFVPCGIVAGIYARTDTTRGVWKAPAGLDAALRGTQGLSYKPTDAQIGQLNPRGINSARSAPVTGRVLWGARTMRGADQLADEYKYIPVRRLALFIEESLYRGTQWVVFEPNDEPLWGQIRLNVGAFMRNLFRQGAFQGSSPRDAYFVKVDAETTTQTDINLGIVNVVVGFAPLKPAEFVVIRIQQIAGQIET